MDLRWGWLKHKDLITTTCGGVPTLQNLQNSSFSECQHIIYGPTTVFHLYEFILSLQSNYEPLQSAMVDLQAYLLPTVVLDSVWVLNNFIDCNYTDSKICPLYFSSIYINRVTDTFVLELLLGSDHWKTSSNARNLQNPPWELILWTSSL